MKLFWTLYVVLFCTHGTLGQSVKGLSFVGGSHSSPAVYSRQKTQKSFQVAEFPQLNQQHESEQKLNVPASNNLENHLHYSSGVMDIKPKPILISRSHSIQSDYNQARDSGRQDTPEQIHIQQNAEKQNAFYNIPKDQQPSGELNGQLNKTQENWFRYMKKFPKELGQFQVLTHKIDYNVFNGQGDLQMVQVSPKPNVGIPVIYYEGYGPTQQFNQSSAVDSSGVHQTRLSPIYQDDQYQITRPNVVGTSVVHQTGSAHQIEQFQIPKPGVVKTPLVQQTGAGPVYQNNHIPVMQQVDFVPMYPITQSPVIHHVPMKYFKFSIPQSRIVTPMIQVTRPEQQYSTNIQQNSTIENSRRDQNSMNQTNYQISKKMENHTQIRTPVFITGPKHSNGYKYMVVQEQPMPVSLSRPMIYRESPIPAGHMAHLPVVQKLNEVQPVNYYYTVPVQTILTTKLVRPIHNFFVPPYRHPYPIEQTIRMPIYTINSLHQPMYYGINNQMESNNQKQQQLVHTIPIVNNDQNNLVTTVTIEALSDQNSRNDKPIHVESDYKKQYINEPITFTNHYQLKPVDKQPQMNVFIGKDNNSGYRLMIPNQTFKSVSVNKQQPSENSYESQIEYSQIKAADEESSEHEPDSRSYDTVGQTLNIGQHGWSAQELSDNSSAEEKHGLTRGVELNISSVKK